MPQPVAPPHRVRLPLGVSHGTHGAYTNHDCRCTACRAYIADYMRRYRRTHKALGLCRDCAAPAEPNRARCRRHLRGETCALSD